MKESSVKLVKLCNFFAKKKELKKRAPLLPLIQKIYLLIDALEYK